jgi:hypothetical protein
MEALDHLYEIAFALGLVEPLPALGKMNPSQNMKQ